MTRKRKADVILALLRKALWGGNGDLGVAGELPGDDAQWKELLDAAGTQLVLPLVIDGMDGLPENSRPCLDLIMDLAPQVDETERENRVINALSRKLKSHFERNGLRPIIQKGAVIASYYPIPGHRTTGDIDVFLEGDEWQKGVQDITNRHNARGSAGNDDDLPAIQIVRISPDGSFCFVTAGRTVEIHKSFYDSRYDFPGLNRRSPEAHIILMSTHILKHCLSSGIRIKHLCDYAVARYTFKYDKGLVDSEMEKAGLVKWQKALDECADFLRIGGDDAPAAVRRILARVPFSISLSDCKPHKLRTAVGFLGALPFALRYAPGEWFHTIRYLIKGNL